MPKIPAQLQKQDFVTINAAGVPAGRLATQVVKFLLGKHTASYLRRMPAANQWVKIENIKQLRFTGRKLQQKTFYHHTGYMGHLKEENMGKMFEQDPQRVFRHIVRGMLPKNKWRDTLLKHIIFI